jgi:hypothetical protein
MNRLPQSIFWMLSFFLMLPSAFSSQDDWPRTLPLDEGTITIYELQPDKMDDGVLHYRAALAYRSTPGGAPVFGAGWFASQVDVDQPRGIVRPKNLRVTATRFPAGTRDVQADVSAAVNEESPGWNLSFPLDELQMCLRP